jgi:nucleoside-diphosphate-sugar epimerase
MTTINKSNPVLVTGATGYVAGWIVKKLLDEGFTVHAAVRNPTNKDSVSHLIQLAEKSKGSLKFFKADLLDEGAYDNAMKGCELVFHTASPFINKVNNPQRDLVDPALLGTSNVLESANRIETVKRVVLTSSVAAIIGDAVDCQRYPGGIATEEQWNFSSTIDHQPYSYSKTVAERKAWEIAGKQKRWDLVVINPSLVIGPGIKPAFNSESFRIIKQLGDGTSRLGVPSFSIGVVDVRDLAEAHYNAGFLPEANGRHIISAQETSLLSLSQMLSTHFGNDFHFAKGTLPRLMVLLMAPLAGFKRKMIKRNIGYPWRADNSKGIKVLGMKYRPVEKSITDMFQQMIDSGLVKDKRKKI